MQVEPEEGVMGDRPECRVFWGSRVTPEESIPMHAGTSKQSVFEHVDRRAELLPQSGAQRRLHHLFSHNVCSFLFLFSICYHQKRSESNLATTYFTNTFPIHWTKNPAESIFGRGKNPVKGTPSLSRLFTPMGTTGWLANLIFPPHEGYECVRCRRCFCRISLAFFGGICTARTAKKGEVPRLYSGVSIQKTITYKEVSSCQ